MLPTLLNPLRRKIKQVSADGAYDTKACHALLKKKGRKPPYRREKMRRRGRRAIPVTRL
ncbi:transposase [Aeromonas schubertii]|nr:transposase [Aeromonas schubertii]